MKLARDLSLAVCALLLAAILLAVSGCAPALIREATAIPHFDAEYTPTPGDSMAKPLAELTQRLTEWGVTVEYADGRAINGWGLADVKGRRIYVNESLGVNGRFEVLAHEAGHLFQPVSLRDVAVAQVFAERVGVGVQQFYGSKTALKSGAKYLAGMKEGFAAEKYYRREIEYAIRALTGQVPLPAWREAQP